MPDLMVDDYLDLMDEIIDRAQAVPFSNKKSIVEVDQLRDCIDKIRLNLPSEIKQAKKIVQERKSIIDEANRQSEDIVTRAEARAKDMVADSEITKTAEAKAIEITKSAEIKAAEIESQALNQSKTLKKATDEYITSTLSKAENTISDSLAAIRKIKGTIKSSANPAESRQQNDQRPEQPLK